MPKLEQQPRLTSVASDVIEWARRVVGAVNPLVDSSATQAAQIAALQGYTGGPAFSMYLSADQTISGGVYTYAQFNATEFDATSNVVLGSYAFVAPVAGYYQINANIIGNWSGSGNDFRAQIWKNGVSVAYHLGIEQTIFGLATISMSKLIQCAAGDTIQFVGSMNAPGGTFKYLSGIGNTTLSGFLARHI
jgi:hypothetical protein